MVLFTEVYDFLAFVYFAVTIAIFCTKELSEVAQPKKILFGVSSPDSAGVFWVSWFVWYVLRTIDM